MKENQSLSQTGTCGCRCEWQVFQVGGVSGEAGGVMDWTHNREEQCPPISRPPSCCWKGDEEMREMGWKGSAEMCVCVGWS